MASSATPTLSSYCQKLPPDAKSRYLEKIQLISGLDPFCPFSLEKKSSILPPVDASDIVSYLVLQTSFVTAKQFKAHKSLEAYNQFVCGWVKDVQAFQMNAKFVVTARVSQAVSFVALPYTYYYYYIMYISKTLLITIFR